MQSSAENGTATSPLHTSTKAGLAVLKFCQGRSSCEQLPGLLKELQQRGALSKLACLANQQVQQAQQAQEQEQAQQEQQQEAERQLQPQHNQGFNGGLEVLPAVAAPGPAGPAATEAPASSVPAAPQLLGSPNLGPGCQWQQQQQQPEDSLLAAAAAAAAASSGADGPHLSWLLELGPTAQWQEAPDSEIEAAVAEEPGISQEEEGGQRAAQKTAAATGTEQPNRRPGRALRPAAVRRPPAWRQLSDGGVLTSNGHSSGAGSGGGVEDNDSPSSSGASQEGAGGSVDGTSGSESGSGSGSDAGARACRQALNPKGSAAKQAHAAAIKSGVWTWRVSATVCSCGRLYVPGGCGKRWPASCCVLPGLLASLPGALPAAPA